MYLDYENKIHPFIISIFYVCVKHITIKIIANNGLLSLTDNNR